MQTNSPYKTAAELGITEELRQGLIILARDLADGTVPSERFDMFQTCGTACCIGGHLAERGIIDLYKSWSDAHPSLESLFFPNGPAIVCTEPLRGSRAIVNFLTLKDPRWDDVMREPDPATSNTERAANEEAAAGALAAIERVLAGDLDDFDADDSGAMTHVLEEVA